MFKKMIGIRNDADEALAQLNRLRQATDIHMMETSNAIKQGLDKIENDLKTAKVLERLASRLLSHN